MGAAVKPIKSGQRISVGAKRPARYRSPIDKAKGYEVVWDDVKPMFEAARRVTNATFVYFIGEPNNGALKIGTSKDPIARLRTMQTGNPRRLRVERVLLGSAHTEKLLHEMWEQHAIRSARSATKTDAAPGTEWFEPTIRAELLPVIQTAEAHQIDYIFSGTETIDEMHLETIIRTAHGEHGITATRRDVPQLLGTTVGYVAGARRTRI